MLQILFHSPLRIFFILVVNPQIIYITKLYIITTLYKVVLMDDDFMIINSKVQLVNVMVSCPSIRIGMVPGTMNPTVGASRVGQLRAPTVIIKHLLE